MINRHCKTNQIGEPWFAKSKLQYGRCDIDRVAPLVVSSGAGGGRDTVVNIDLVTICAVAMALRNILCNNQLN